ncbi:hypothetical protein ACWGJ9_08560 [Curtobacterium citreum]
MTNTRRQLNRNRRLRRTATVTTIAATATALTGGALLSAAQAEQATALHATALHAVQTEANLGGKLVTSSRQVRTDGRAAIVAATGKTIDIKATAAAERHLVALSAATTALADAAADARKVVHDNSGAHVAYWDLGTLDARLGKVTLAPERTALIAAQRAVTADKKALADAVTAWQAEQDRIAAEKAAAAKAAEEKAAADRAQTAAAAASAVRPAPARNATKSPAAAPRSTAPAQTAPAPAPAPAAQSKLAIAQGVFARYGFSNVTYGAGVAQGHYGATSLDSQHIYMDLDRIPAERVASVAIHEYQHIKQARMYGGYDAVLAHYGSTIAMEQEADRMARADGATWTNYI